MTVSAATKKPDKLPPKTQTVVSEFSQATVIGPSSKVRMHFSISLEDGTVAETTRDDNEPLEFVMGDGTMIQGLELALYGLKAGDKQTLTIEPDLAFGYHDPDNVHSMSIDEFPQDMQLAKGVIIEFNTPAGDEVPGTIRDIGEGAVKVDFNHPLAGHEITFDVEILSVESPS
jgi:FKBP-type peptidyl-prolyl cis-trans isomerase SlpA